MIERSIIDKKLINDIVFWSHCSISFFLHFEQLQKILKVNKYHYSF